MEGVPYDWSDYLISEGLSDMMPTGSGLHGGQAGQVGGGSGSGLSVTDLDCSWNSSASRMIQAGETAGCPSTAMHAWHNPPIASQYEIYDADGSQGYDIAGCVRSECAEDLPQVAPNDETIPSEDQYRTQSSAGNLEPSEAGINSFSSQQVLGSIVSQTETDREVSKLGPDELKVLVPDQACHCATCLDGYTLSHHELRWALKDEAPAWTARTLSCRVTGCQWTTKDEPTILILTNFGLLIRHEGQRERHHDKGGKWRCLEAGCKVVTKRWMDLLRHTTSKHCIKPRDLKCPVLECKYHHVDFSRKDKLKSHVEKVHKGVPQPAKRNQAIKPKVKDHA
ncbi:hypothetical protein BDR22DRAFT_890213 [Usnea florida]